MTVVVSSMVAGLTTLSFAAQAAEKNVQMAPAECRESIDEKLVEQAHSIVFKMNLKGEITFFNEFAQKFFGFPEKEILGKNLIGTIAPQTESSGRDLQPILEDLVRHPERHVTNTNENISRSGKRVWVSWVNLPVIDKSGNVTEVLCIGNPIMNEKKEGLAALAPKKH
jgi:PAS domain S-box-containing protein